MTFLALVFTVEGWRLGLWVEPDTSFAQRAARHLLNKVAELELGAIVATPGVDVGACTRDERLIKAFSIPSLTLLKREHVSHGS